MASGSVEALTLQEFVTPSSADWVVLAALTPAETSPTMDVRQQIKDLIQFQRRFQTGCLLISAYMAAAAYGRLLPQAHDFLRAAAAKYRGILETNTLSPSHHHFDQALDIYKDVAVQVAHLTINREGAKILIDNGVAFGSLSVPTETTASWKPLTYTHLEPPFGIWVHQLGCNDSHFITVDGSPEADELIADYQADLYRPIATLEFAAQAEESG